MPTHRCARRFGLGEQIAAERLQAGVVGECRKRQLPDILQGDLVLEACEDLARLVDDDLHGPLGDRDRRRHEEPVDRDQLAERIRIEGTGTGIDGFAGRALDLEPALAGQSHVESVAGAGQRALNMNVADGGGADAEADIGAFGDHGLVAAVRRAGQPLRLVQQIGELGAGAL